MIEPIFTPFNRPAHGYLAETDPRTLEQSRDKALLHRAISLAIESAFSRGQDLPVGAVAASGNMIVGRSVASDRRINIKRAHAEFMAVQDAVMQSLRSGAPKPDTIVVTLEPCDNCQDFLATLPNVKRVGFGLSRAQVAENGLVKPHDETIFQRALKVNLPYQIIQIDDPDLQQVGEIVLDHTRRDIHDEHVEIDHNGLRQALISFNG